MRGTLRRRGPSWQLLVHGGVDARGRRVQLSRTVRVDTKREAERALRAFVGEVEAGAASVERRTVGELLDRWHEHKSARGRSVTTLREYRRLIDYRLKPRLGTVALERVTGRDLDLYYDELVAEGLAPATVRQFHAVLRGAFGQAVKWEWLGSNPAVRATPPPLRRPDVRAPEPAEVLRLIGAAEGDDPAFAVFLRLAVVTGARRGELCALRWRDIDLEDGVLNVARSMAEGKGGHLVEKSTKTHAERRVRLDEETVEVLHGHRARADEVAAACGVGLSPAAFVFSRKVDGSAPLHPNDATAAFGRLCRQVGVEGVRLHDLRHFAATRLLAAGVPVRQVSGRLGHANASTTLNFYAHAVAELDAVAADVLAGLLRQPAAPEARRAGEPAPPPAPPVAART